MFSLFYIFIQEQTQMTMTTVPEW